MRIEIPQFADKKDLFEYLKANKESLISQKKKLPIKSDPFTFSIEHSKEETTKAFSGTLKEDQIYVKVVMNTTNLMDSHSDVHVSGIWKKTLSDNKTFYHLQEHEADFTKVISDNAKAYMQAMTWKELGYKFEGNTDALVFESIVSKERNEEMYRQYKNGWVKNHSVGMQYVKLDLAINDEESDKEFTFWNKYIGIIANRKDAETQGYFWVIQEAKLMEGSAVVFGSNRATPTLEVQEPDSSTPKEEPTIVTHKFNVLEAIKNTKFVTI
jgi:hypothetical protein